VAVTVAGDLGRRPARGRARDCGRGHRPSRGPDSHLGRLMEVTLVDCGPAQTAVYIPSRCPYLPIRGPARARARVAPLSLSICHQVFPPNTLFHRHRPIRPVRLTGFQQARQAFP
jgi:hypothetical protein